MRTSGYSSRTPETREPPVSGVGGRWSCVVLCCGVAWLSASCAHRGSAPASARSPTVLVRFGATEYPPPWEWNRRRHRGVDFAVGEDGRVVAMHDGKVVLVGGIDSGWVGREVIIDHPSMAYWVDYGHLASIDVATGDVVHRGQVIGAAVRPGHSAGASVSPEEWSPHVHVEMCADPCRNRFVDPLKLRPKCLSEAAEGDIVYPVPC
ncbi:MAG: M23 family metallopeptidase [Rhodoglobus sp.]